MGRNVDRKAVHLRHLRIVAYSLTFPMALGFILYIGATLS